MSIFSSIKKKLPSYRQSEEIKKKINYLDTKLNEISRQISTADKKNEYLFFLSQKREGETLAETKQRVFLSFPPAEGTLRQIQLGSNIILKKIKMICDNNDIRFFLSDGTLMGAVRHHGFIPWDDDIDISFFRNDYLRFRDILRDDPDLELAIYYGYSRVNDVINVNRKVKLKGSNSFFVDIFIYDYMDFNGENISAKTDEYLRLNREFHNSFLNKIKTSGVNFDYSSKTPKPYHEIDEIFNSLRENTTENVIRSDDSGYFCLGIEQTQRFVKMVGILPTDKYLPYSEASLIFEGERYDSLKDADAFLKHIYGDYMSMPENIFPHHLNEIGELTEEDLSILSLSYL